MTSPSSIKQPATFPTWIYDESPIDDPFGYGERAVINLARWATAVPDYQGDVATYRQYVVNHEVGHALGQGHEPCPGAGQPAPVMQQQTLGLEGCTKNAWPYP